MLYYSDPHSFLSDPAVRQVLAEAPCGLGLLDNIGSAHRRHELSTEAHKWLMSLPLEYLRQLVVSAHDRAQRRRARQVSEAARQGSPLLGARRAWECGGRVWSTPQAASGYARRVGNASLRATYEGGCSGSYTYPVRRVLVAIR